MAKDDAKSTMYKTIPITVETYSAQNINSDKIEKLQWVKLLLFRIHLINLFLIGTHSLHLLSKLSTSKHMIEK